MVHLMQHLHGTYQEPVDPCADLADSQEPNDAMSDATDASAGGTYTAALCPTTDLDMYMVNTVAGGTISLETLPVLFQIMWVIRYLYLYDAAGTQLAIMMMVLMVIVLSFNILLLQMESITLKFPCPHGHQVRVFDYSAIVVNDDPPLYTSYVYCI